MPKALYLDLRVRVLAALDRGMSRRAAARLFGVSLNSIRNWRALRREQGHAGPRNTGGDTRSWRIEAERDTILGLLERNPDLTAAALRRALAARGLVFGDNAVRNFLKRRGIERPQGRPRKPAGSPERRAATAARCIEPGRRFSVAGAVRCVKGGG